MMREYFLYEPVIGSRLLSFATFCSSLTLLRELNYPTAPTASAFYYQHGQAYKDDHHEGRQGIQAIAQGRSTSACIPPSANAHLAAASHGHGQSSVLGTFEPSFVCAFKSSSIDDASELCRSAHTVSSVVSGVDAAVTDSG
ncbi:unnamed protein product [Phytophthora fragariaefolia]|uniref:Unnamed protein product n=1 Tax=Phytophthora fragariaefolia TaxID=1490495 RepID=A0A9W6X028_9STRA|nr:unnamed protein product [Phytophthora fragariaefolia]